jgi:hypothetical protein
LVQVRSLTVPFVKAYQPGLPLFFVNRQMYKEASSIFYTNNTFITTKIHTQRNAKKEDYSCLGLTMFWLGKLGSNIHLLRKLEIDFETIFLWKKRTFSWRKCRAVPGIFIEFGPLIHFIWRHDLRLDIRAVQPIGKTQDSATNHTTNRTVAPRIGSVMIHTLNPILGSLLRDDLNLKRYTKGTQSSISSISLIPNGSFSVIAFASTKSVDESECALTPFFHSTSGYSGLEHVVRQGFNHIQHFRYTGNGVNWMPKDTPGYFTLLLHLRRRIIRLSSTYQQTQILSLDNAHTIVGAMAPLMIDDT